jgi:hypothetical protein
MMAVDLSTLTRLTKGGIVVGMFGALVWTGLAIAQDNSGCSGSGICTGSCTISGGNGCCAADPSNNDKCTCYSVNSGCS